MATLPLFLLSCVLGRDMLLGEPSTIMKAYEERAPTATLTHELLAYMLAMDGLAAGSTGKGTRSKRKRNHIKRSPVVPVTLPTKSHIRFWDQHTEKTVGPAHRNNADSAPRSYTYKHPRPSGSGCRWPPTVRCLTDHLSERFRPLAGLETLQLATTVISLSVIFRGSTSVA